MPTPIARWNPARSVWETNETLICGHSDVWSETWPSSGMWADGQVYELPTSAPLTDGSACSSLLGRNLATPTAAVATGGPPQDSRGKRDLRLDIAALLPTPAACVANDGESTETWLARRERVKATGVNGNGMGMPLTIAVQLLPTPTTQDAANTGGPAQFDRNSLPLNAVAPTLLPTPRATDGTKGGPNQRGSSGDEMLPSAVQRFVRLDWDEPTPGDFLEHM